MRWIISAILAASLLLHATSQSVADCPTAAQARAANPQRHLVYLTRGSSKCWFAGSPLPRQPSAATKAKSEPLRSSDDDKLNAEPTGAPPVATSNDDSVTASTSAPGPVATTEGLAETRALFRRLQSSGYRVGESDVTPRRVDADEAEGPPSFEAFQRHVLGPDPINVATDATRPSDPREMPAQAKQLSVETDATRLTEMPGQSVQSSPERPPSEIVGHVMVLIRILAALVIGIGAFVILRRPLAGASERSARRAAERDPANAPSAPMSGPPTGQKLATVQVRDEPVPTTGLVRFVETSVSNRPVSAPDGSSDGALLRAVANLRRMVGLMDRTEEYIDPGEAARKATFSRGSRPDGAPVA